MQKRRIPAITLNCVLNWDLSFKGHTYRFLPNKDNVLTRADYKILRVSGRKFSNVYDAGYFARRGG